MRATWLWLVLVGLGCRGSAPGVSAAGERSCAHRRETEWLAFSPDSQHLVSTGADGLKVWALDGRPEAIVSEEQTPKRGVFDERGHFVGAVEGGVFELTLAPPFARRFVALENFSRRLGAVIGGSRGGRVAWLQGDSLRVVDLDAPTQVIRHALPGVEASFTATAGDRLVIVSMARDRNALAKVRVFDLGEPEVAPGVLAAGTSPRQPVLSADGRLLAMHLDSQLVVFDLASAKELWRARSSRNGLVPNGFSADGKWLFAGDDKFDQMTFDVFTGEERGRDPYVPGKQGMWIRTVSGPRAEGIFCREGDRLEIYDLDLKRIGTLGAPGQYGIQHVSRALEASPDGKWVAVEHASRVHLWNLETRQVTYLVDPAIKSQVPCTE